MSDEQKKEYEFIKHPKHYNKHPSGVECIEVIQHFPVNIAFAVKHLWRCDLKPNTTAIQDINKAIEYLEFEKKRIAKFKNDQIETTV